MEKIPGIIVESCAAGGGRADALTLSVCEMCSCSDTHESVDAPIVAANQHYILPPAQAQIWCTMRPYFSENHFAYSIASGFLGRLCWSGNLADLDSEQFANVKRANEMYNRVSGIIKSGDSYIYRTGEFDYRRPKGSQAVVRYTHDRSKALVVYHNFYEPVAMNIELEGEYGICERLYEDSVKVCGGVLEISGEKSIFGNVIVLERK